MPRQRGHRAAAPSLILALLVAGLGLGACGDDGGGREKRGEEPLDLVIGNSVPLSGALGDLGPASRKAAELALEEIRAAIKADQRDDSVKLVTEDNATDPRKTIATVRTMVEDDGASCIVGPWTPSEVVTVSRDVAVPNGVALISPAATLDELTTLDDRRLVNRTVPPDSYQGRALAEAIVDDLGDAKGESVSIAARDDAYGEPIAAAFESAWKEAGGEIAVRDLYDPDASPATVAKRLASEQADALVVIEFPHGFARLAAALDEAGEYDPENTWGVDFLASTELADEVSGDLSIDGLRGTVPGSPDDDGPSNAFDELFKGGKPADVDRATYDAQTFDAVVLCYLAAVGARSTEGEAIAAELGAVSGPPGEDYSWRELPQAVDALASGKQIDYQGASGPLDLDPQGDPTAGVYDIFEFVSGEPRVVNEVPFRPPGG